MVKHEKHFIDDGFPHTEKKYMCEHCCCGKVHSTTGAKRLAVFVLICLSLSLFVGLKDANLFFPQIALLIFEILATILLLLGIKKQNPRMTIPFVIMMFLMFIGTAIMFFFVLFGVVFPESFVGDYFKHHYNNDKLGSMSPDKSSLTVRLGFIFASFFFGICLIFNYWFYNIAKRAYDYLKDYEEHRKRFGAPAVEGGVLVKHDLK